MRKKLLRLLWVAPVAMLLFADAASAQSTGTIVGVVNDAATGRPVAGALVIATSRSLQGEQTAVTDGRGQYTLTALPPGLYRLSAQLQGFKPAERTDINLRVDFTLRANIAIVPEAVQMEEQVVRTGTAPAVNIGSAEAGTIVSKEFLASVPTARTFETVATVAPTAQFDGYGVSFAGATSPENNYIIDGLRVSSTGYGLLGTNLLTNFIDQIDVKVGSFMPEYGYATAGIINTVTKSGGNEFHGSIWGNLTPGLFTPSTPGTQSAYALASQSTPYKGSYDADFGLEVGGPIVKDKLWFYAGFAPRMTYAARTQYYQQRTPCTGGNCTSTGWQLDQYGQYVMKPIAGTEVGYGSSSTQYNAIAKLTWLINENHNAFVSFNTQPTSGSTNFAGDALASAAPYTTNSTNVTLNYTGKFIDKHLLFEVKGGWYNSYSKSTGNVVAGVNSLNVPGVTWQTAQPLENFVNNFTCPVTGACPVSQYRTGGAGYTEDPTDNRYAGSATFTGLFDLAGQHQLKGGVQIDYSTYDLTKYYAGGGSFYAYGTPGSTSGTISTAANALRMIRGYGELDPNSMISASRSASWCASLTTNADGSVTCNDPGLKSGNAVKLARTSNTWSNAYFLQDSWTIANVLTLNFGVRLDTQTISTPSGSAINPDMPKFAINDSWAPRVQAIWDFTGNGRGKVQANWGMYYETIPLDIAIRAFNAEPGPAGYYQLGSCNLGKSDVKNNPGFNPLVDCPNVYGLSVGSGPGPNTVNLNSPLVSASRRGFGITGGGTYAPWAPDLKAPYNQQFGGGVQYEVLQDLTVGVEYLGRRLSQVIEDMSSDDAASYYIANPAVSKPWTVTSGPYEGQTFNPVNAVGLSGMGVPFSVAWPKPQRDYDAFSFTLNKLFSKRWLAQASYTWSSMRGNYTGLFRTEDGQKDPNLSADYDLISLLGNGNGPLGLNRTNQIKAAGSYNATLSPDVSLVPAVNFRAMSGLPQSAYAIQPIYGQPIANLIPRGMAGNLDWTYQLDLGAKLVWALSGPYTLQFSLDIFNILNMQTAQWTNQTYTLDSANPMNGAQCGSKNAITSKNPIAALQADCPDLPYARTTDGRRVSVNLNYGQPTSSTIFNAYQIPISARFGVQLSF